MMVMMVGRIPALGIGLHGPVGTVVQLIWFEALTLAVSFVISVVVVRTSSSSR